MKQTSQKHTAPHIFPNETRIQKMATYYIQCVDQDENGNNPFWNGKLKSWTPSFDDASRYTQKQL